MCFPHGISAVDQKNCFDAHSMRDCTEKLIDLMEKLEQEKKAKKAQETEAAEAEEGKESEAPKETEKETEAVKEAEAVKEKEESVTEKEVKRVKKEYKVIQDSITKAKRFVCLELGISELHCNMDPGSWKPPYGRNRVEPPENVLRQTLETKMESSETCQLALERLLNRVQTHGCTYNYCKKRVRVATVVEKENPAELANLYRQGLELHSDGNFYKCRFRFPKQITGYHHEYEDSERGQLISSSNREATNEDSLGAVLRPLPDNKNKMEFACLRNHYTISNHIPEISLIWGANTDFTPLLSPRQAKDYTCKYMTKSGDSSKDHKKIVKSTIAKKNANAPAKKAVQSILMENVSKDTPKEECCLQLLRGRNYMSYNLPMSFVNLKDTRKVNLNKKGDEKAISTQENQAEVYFKRESDPGYKKLCEDFDNDSEDYFRRLKKFHPTWKTAVGPRDLSLHSFVAFFTRKWNFSTSESCPVFSPSFKRPPKLRHKDRFEVWARSNILKYLPGATPETIVKKDQSVKNAFELFVTESGHCPRFLLEEWEEIEVEEAQYQMHKAEKRAQKQSKVMSQGVYVIPNVDGPSDSDDSDATDDDASPDVFPDLLPTPNSGHRQEVNFQNNDGMKTHIPFTADMKRLINQKGEPNGDPDGDETYEAGDILQKWKDTDWQTDFRKFVKDDGLLSVCLCGYAKIFFLIYLFFYLVFP